MSFNKGNHYGKGGARVGAGRKKAPSTLVNEALERLDANIPELIDMMYKKAREGDTKCAQYLIDRRLGKPKERGEIEIDAQVTSFLDIARKAREFSSSQ